VLQKILRYLFGKVIPFFVSVGRRWNSSAVLLVVSEPVESLVIQKSLFFNFAYVINIELCGGCSYLRSKKNYSAICLKHLEGHRKPLDGCSNLKKCVIDWNKRMQNWPMESLVVVVVVRLRFSQITISPQL
jgi:hypothetical protein